MSDQTNIGQLTDSNARRDAIHVACAPVVSKEILYPGQHIGFVEQGNTTLVSLKSNNPIGIVDPFLKGCVYADQMFWMLLYPKTVTGLRHEWSHPAFAEDDSVVWLKEFAVKVEKTYEALIETGRDAITTGSAYAGNDTHQRYFDEYKSEFLAHISKVTGLKVVRPEEVYFSCGC